MYLLRCTRPLLTQLRGHLPEAARPRRSSTRLGDWHARRLNSAQQRFIIAVSSKTLLSVVVPAREPARLVTRIAIAVDALLASLDIDAAVRRREISHMQRATLAPASERSMNARASDTARRAWEELYDLPHRPGRTLAHIDLLLAGIPRRSLGDRTPADAALQLLRR